MCRIYLLTCSVVSLSGFSSLLASAGKNVFSPHLASSALSSKFECPIISAGSAAALAIIPASDILSGVVAVTATSSKGNLCTLTLQSSDNVPVPVARSYDGRDWEITAGPFADDLSPPVCSSGVCTIQLTPPDSGDDVSYVLTSYVRDGLAPEAEAARFLEQATFGPTRSTIDELASASGEKYKEWVQNQIENVPMSSHREYYRRYTNPSAEYPSRHAAPGPSKACEQTSRWRKFTLSERDGINSSQSGRAKYLHIEKIGNRYHWFVEGMIRTSTSYLPKLVTRQKGEFIEDFEVWPTLYSFYFRDNERFSCVGCLVQITKKHKNGNVNGAVANPPIDLTGITSQFTIVDLPPINGAPGDISGMVSIDNGYDYTESAYFNSIKRPNDEYLLSDASAVNPTQCDDHPLTDIMGFDTLSKLDVSKNEVVKADDHVQTAAPSIFGRTLNKETGNYEHLLFDPRLILLENTVENPLEDGGGHAYFKTDGYMRCSNAPRTFMNEDHCKISFSKYACTSKTSYQGLNFPLEDIGIEFSNPDELAVVVCGSVSEVSNDVTLGTDDGFDMPRNDGLGGKEWNWSIYLGGEFTAYKRTIWVNHALFDEGQLRQRVAWALYQIVPIGLPLTDSQNAEVWLQYYDIFVRNAFGNYYDVLKEISFCDMMSEWLSFTDNKSLQYNIDDGVGEVHPDENFAREIMQLFSIGLFQLNMDGTKQLDDNGQPIHTYDSSDIVNFSKCWTGFSRLRLHRGNSASAYRGPHVDPLYIEKSYRDVYPKADLFGGYIGDRKPLCSDLPEKDHLRKGAAYRLLGSTPIAELQIDKSDWESKDVISRITLDPSLPLYTKLCVQNSDGICTFPGKIVLNENLVYDSPEAQSSHEFQVDEVRTVRIQFGTKQVHYEYIRVPCVFETFHSGAKKLIRGNIGRTHEVQESVCADPQNKVAAETCCDIGDANLNGKRYCRVHAERVTFDHAADRCAANEAEICHPKRMNKGTENCNEDFQSSIWYAWTSSSCVTRVKISYESPGLVGRVDYPESDFAGKRNVVSSVSESTKNFFKVAWTDDPILPTDKDSCNVISSCYSTGDGCICDTTVTKSAVFNSIGDISSIQSITSSLFVGAFNPEMYKDGELSFLGDCGLDNVEVYSTSTDDSCSNLGVNSFFGVTDGGIHRYLKNIQSFVDINNIDASFRNVPSFIGWVDQDLRDMYYETDAVLEHFHHHPSHPPFLAIRLLQRFGISNPSPGYIKRVATAYINGSYDGIGSESYGDLAAMISAILLDDESRSASIDADPSHGHLREPALKITSFFRSMDAQYHDPLGRDKMRKIRNSGQDAYGTPSVFSFFEPEFQPSGVIEQAGLVAPEAQILTGKYVTTLLDGLFSMVKFGLTSCFNGYGSTGELGNCPDYDGDIENASGIIGYKPPEGASADAIVDDLALLLTAGRLGSTNRGIIVGAIEESVNEGDESKATRIAQQLMISTPEFHSWGGVHENGGTKRKIQGYTKPPKHSYKTVVVFMMEGGADSYNMIIPKKKCKSKDMFAEYKNARKSIAENPDKLHEINANGQICDTWGIHRSFPILKDLYDKEEAVFFLNMGILSKPMTKHDNWVRDSKIQLFAHNHMTREQLKLDPHDKNAGTGVGGRMLDMLKKNGYQTSGNTVDGSSLLNVGDTYYSNPVTTVATGDVAVIDEISTVGTDKMLNWMKLLNGESSDRNYTMIGETWSDRLSKALFEYETALDIDASIKSGEFQMDGYKKDEKIQIEKEFRAAAQFIKSRSLRKVDREVYFVRQPGFDMHGGGGLEKLPAMFTEANDALEKFIAEIKSQGIWENTVILMASDFGRSITPNSNGGTDHAWGGHYFMLGGGLKGGKIHGEYPEDLSDKSDLWVRRGRMIPTTPWDAVWQGISGWMGVKGDDDLNFILPSRSYFDKCSDLFADHDLFTGIPSSECIDDADGDGVADDDDRCPGTTYWLAAEVDEFGCQAPTSSPPSIEPVPTSLPTPSTPAPTPEAPDGNIYQAEYAGNIFSNSEVKSSYEGYTGFGYVDMGGEGSYIEWPVVDFGEGGSCKLEFRYAARKKSRPSNIVIDGEKYGELDFKDRSEWTDYRYDTLETICPSGTHTVRLEAKKSNGGPNVDHLLVSIERETTPTIDPTKHPSSNPSNTLPTTSPTTSHPTIYPTSGPSSNPSNTPPTTSPTTSHPTTIMPTAEIIPTLSPSIGQKSEWEAEDTANVLSSALVKSSNVGFTGSGYVDMGGEGSYIEWPAINFGKGGPCKLEFRYAAKKKPRNSKIKIDGEKIGELDFKDRGEWTDYRYDTLETTCPSGTHSVSIIAGSNGGPNVDHLRISVERETTPTIDPMKHPSSNPSIEPTSEPPISPSPSMNPSYNPSSVPRTPSPSNYPTGVESSDPTAAPEGCYSINYKDCFPDGFGFVDSISCSSALKWLPNGGLNNCIALWGVCDGETTSCCVHLTCVSDGSSSACVPLSDVTPTRSPSPTGQPSATRTREPSSNPSRESSLAPSLELLGVPTNQPSLESSSEPSKSDSATSKPSIHPSNVPTAGVTDGPPTRSLIPTSQPSLESSDKPSVKPSLIPSLEVSLEPSFEPSYKPSSKATTNPSYEPSRSPVLYSPPPSESGGSLNTQVHSVIASAAITVLGVSACDNAVDGTTNICTINRNSFPERNQAGFIAITSGKSIVKKLRIYQNHVNRRTDPTMYQIMGRNGGASSSEDWTLIAEESISFNKKRNSEGLTISSTYDEGDLSLQFTETEFLENNLEFSQYQVIFSKTDDNGQRNVQFAEFELPGLI